MSWISVGVGAAVGLGSYASQEGAYNRKKQLAASTQRYSPWTHQQAEIPNEPNAIGDIGSGVSTGLMLHQGMANADLQQQLAKQQSDLMQAQTKWLNTGYSPYSSGWGGTGYDPTLANANPWSLGVNTNLAQGMNLNPNQYNY